MAGVNIPIYSGTDVTTHNGEHDMDAKNKSADVQITSSGASADGSNHAGQVSLVPLRMKLLSILLVTAVGFGSHWSSGVTGAMKSTLKKVRHQAQISNGLSNHNQCRNCTSITPNTRFSKLARTL
jgi:hypothetical protein